MLFSLAIWFLIFFVTCFLLRHGRTHADKSKKLRWNVYWFFAPIILLSTTFTFIAYPNPFLFVLNIDRVVMGFTTIAEQEAQRNSSELSFLANTYISVYKENSYVSIESFVDSLYIYNVFSYNTDMENYGVLDYAALPSEFIAQNGGDCEDKVLFTMTLAKVVEKRGLPQPKLIETHQTNHDYITRVDIKTNTTVSIWKINEPTKNVIDEHVSATLYTLSQIPLARWGIFIILLVIQIFLIYILKK